MTDLIPMKEAVARIGEFMTENQRLKTEIKKFNKRFKVLQDLQKNGYLTVNRDAEITLREALWDY
mgnify:CR=1 FL=1